MFKSKILHTLTLGTLLTPLPTYSSHNHLLESPEYVVYIISTTLGMFIAYSLLKFNWKKYQNHMLNKYMYILSTDPFLSFCSKKNQSLWLIIAIKWVFCIYCQSLLFPLVIWSRSSHYRSSQRN